MILGVTPLGQFPLGWLPLGPAAIVPSPPPAARTFTAGQMRGATATITPAEIIDYAINWAPLLNSGETILTSEWQSTGVSTDANAPQIQDSDVATTVWLNGGICGLNYLVTNTITTSEGREFQATFSCRVIAYNPL